MRRVIAIVVLVALGLGLGGCSGMAIEKLNVSLQGPYTYEKQTGMYVITRVYPLPVDPELAVCSANGTEAAGAIPASFEITHTDGATVVTMVEVSRNCRGHSLADGSHRTDVTVTYEGHVPGVMYAELDAMGGSAPILVDLVTHKGIGPNMEGTNRIVPNSTITIVRNATAATALGYFTLAGQLTGYTNEAAWRDPVFDAVWPAGVWLFQGAPATPNRDGTYTFRYGFRYSGISHAFRWRDYIDTTEKKIVKGVEKEQPVRIYADEETVSTIYPAPVGMPIIPLIGFWTLFGGE